MKAVQGGSGARSGTATGIVPRGLVGVVSPSVERTDPEGVDHGWVMQVTFVLTILVGAPLVGLLSVLTALPTWESRVAFAVRVGAVVWLCTAVGVYAYARWYRPSDGGAVEAT